jgi:hypothetical protein
MQSPLKRLEFGSFRSGKIDFDDIVNIVIVACIGYAAYAYFSGASFNAPKKELLDECVSYIDKPVTQDFNKMSVDGYKHKSHSPTMSVFTKDGKVSICSVGLAFKTTHEASEWRALFYDAFKSGGWQYFESWNDRTEVFVKGGFVAELSPTSTREDRMSTAMVIISRKER